MKVGDLVKWAGGGYERLIVGLIINFDKDGDPIVEFYDPSMASAAYYSADVEVINENR